MVAPPATSRVVRVVCGQMIASRRRTRGLSQAVLAARAGLSQPVVSRVEAGATDLDILAWRRLAVAFGDDAKAWLQLFDEVVELAARGAAAATRRADPLPWDALEEMVGEAGFVGLFTCAVEVAFRRHDAAEATGDGPAALV